MCCDMDDDYIASGSGDGTVRVWKILTADCEEVLDGGISEVVSLLVQYTNSLFWFISATCQLLVLVYYCNMSTPCFSLLVQHTNSF